MNGTRLLFSIILSVPRVPCVFVCMCRLLLINHQLIIQYLHISYIMYNISDNYSSWALRAFHTYFYNHAHRLRLENHYIKSFLEAPTDIVNHFWIQVAVT
jgi:hypothetical protein